MSVTYSNIQCKTCKGDTVPTKNFSWMYNTGNKPVNLFKTPDDEDFVNKVSFEKKDKINYNKPIKKNN